MVRKIKARLRNKSDDTLKLAAITENAREYAVLAYEQEEKRENSLINQATQMTTYFSFVSVIVLMIIPLILTDEPIVSVKYLITVSIIELTLLFTSMVLAVIVQWRFKYKALSSPMVMFNHIIEKYEYFLTEEQRNKSFVQSLETAWKSKRDINNKRSRLILSSMIVFFIAIGFLIFSLFFGIILYIL